jgi:signal transduction histidine kinase
MNSLRTRIAVILVGAIACVVGLATAICIIVLDVGNPHTMPAVSARQILAFTALAKAAAEGTNPAFLDKAVAGVPQEHFEKSIERALGTLDPHARIVVTQPAGDRDAVASIEIAAGRWIALPMPGPPPTGEGWLVLGGWILLVVIGTSFVAVLMADRVIRPLALLESAATAAADGSVEPVPETGPAEVRAAAKAINKLSQSLRHAMEGRMRLVAAAGHDLRTPMTRMRLRAEFLAEEEREVWRRDIDELGRIADSAIRLVREAADTSASEPIGLDGLLGETITELQQQGFRIAATELAPVRISGSPLAVTRALRNLLINAATHGEGGTVHLTCTGGEAVVAIDDLGPGIPRELVGRVFEPFFRVDPARRQSTPGAGLGLAIAKEIITRHGGTITLSNRPTGGLSQVIRLPALAEDG